MSMWYSVEDQENVELSEDGETIDILYSTDHNGNNYVEVPVALIKKALNIEDGE